MSKQTRSLKTKLQNLTVNQKLGIIVGIGVFVRLVLMPFFAHVDLASTYNRAYLMAFGGANWLQFGQQLSHIIEAVWLRVFGIFTDPQTFLPITNNPDQNIWLWRNLVIFKALYLLFDLGVVYLMWQLLKNNSRKLWAVAFYFLNPVLIFAVYIFGRYEIFPIFFLLLGIWLLQKSYKWAAYLTWGLMILARTSFLMFIPAIWLVTGKSWKEKIVSGFLMVLPYGLVQVYQLFLLKSQAEVNWLREGDHVNYITGLTLNLNDVLGVEIYPFLIVYALILFYGFYLWLERKTDETTLVTFLNLVVICFAGLTFYHPQYLAWAVAPMALLIAQAKNWKYVLIVWIGLVLAYPLTMLSWDGHILFEVARPLGNWWGDKNLNGIVGRYYDPFKLANMARSVMTAGFVVLGWMVVRDSLLAKISASHKPQAEVKRVK